MLGVVRRAHPREPLPASRRELPDGSRVSTVTQFSPGRVIEKSPPPGYVVVASTGLTRPALSLSFSR